jgi:hypothetical protein
MAFDLGGRFSRGSGEEVAERIDDISADLPYELQSKMFDHLSGVSLAGAGLTVTLIGSVLKDAPPIVWLSVIEFGLAAFVATTGNLKMIERLFQRRETIRTSKIATMATIALIGMAIGSLGMSVYYDRDGAHAHHGAKAPQPQERAKG